MMHRVIIPGCLALALSSACAYNATGTPVLKNITFEYSVQAGAQISTNPNLTYYLVINDDADPAKAPYINGPTPQTHPYPRAESFLPWIRWNSPEYFLDITDTLPLPQSYWHYYFALYIENGQQVMWQGKLNDDGTINERFHQMIPHSEWGVQGGTVQINMPMATFLGHDTTFKDFPSQFQANLAVAVSRDNVRDRGTFYYNFSIIKRWGLVQNQSITLPTGAGDQTITDPNSGVQFASNLPQGVDQGSVNIVSYHYHITDGSSSGP